MENSNDDPIKVTELTTFITQKIIIGILVAVIFLFLLVKGLEFFTKHSLPEPVIQKTQTKSEEKKHDVKEEHPPAKEHTVVKEHEPLKENVTVKEPVASKEHAVIQEHAPAKEQAKPQEHVVEKKSVAESHSTGHGATPKVKRDTSGVIGVSFVMAAIEPLNYELNERFWGWRPNDILDFTDNINNFQLGVLEVTRRTAKVLAEKISRTGSSAAFDPGLELAMSWFSIKAEQYWFPSAESRYNAGLDELLSYAEKLKKGEARFFTRTDNLIPLLEEFENLLGSCDENLVKQKEEDGSYVSFFKADDYFYYAMGVASAMQTILEAVSEDFKETLRARNGAETLAHATEYCHRATTIHPIIILDASLSSILANHRANMAAPISHARFYLEVLSKTLGT
ncbi:MAG: DUF2333 family protein [Desulfobacterales bacterium]|nr:DUF2333 family protein [Desulfobacterales bacterium]MBF0396072.1 DUF2333 family protein [Desulfobacterales bacterium]